MEAEADGVPWPLGPSFVCKATSSPTYRGATKQKMGFYHLLTRELSRLSLSKRTALCHHTSHGVLGEPRHPSGSAENSQYRSVSSQEAWSGTKGKGIFSEPLSWNLNTGLCLPCCGFGATSQLAGCLNAPFFPKRMILSQSWVSHSGRSDGGQCQTRYIGNVAQHNIRRHLLLDYNVETLHQFLSTSILIIFTLFQKQKRRGHFQTYFEMPTFP